MKKKYRTIVVGCGKIGALFEAERKRPKPASHAGAVMANRNTELAALIDPDTRTLAKAGKLFPRASRYTSLARCLKKERPDIAIVATPPSARLSIIRACVKARVRMIVCEKPLAANTRQARAIRNSLRGARIVFVLNYQRRFSPLFDAVRRDIKKGAIGAIQQVTCRYSNGVRNNGGHIIDALAYLLDERAVSARALKNKNNPACPAGDMNADCMLTLRSGATVSMQSFDQRRYAVHDICLYGERGAISITDFGQRARWYKSGLSDFAGLLALKERADKEMHVPLSATAGALEAALKQQKPPDGLEQGAYVLKAVEAIVKSARAGGKPIRIS